ncbi:putative Polyketide synthase PksR [Glarea lozoyensis 74030]|uniref:Putative Polyketide synthase PksR n=1 Tax=Glarea lozoyensis (strain ATCC 74030 / MF5533) TaxID=1104152 RepID=H0ERV1_GLAL7|nr:putative Polyketide synthase PksR [Glarea lozoyensis 74030]
MEDNPMCIQYSPYENSRHATPLVLIHDGGGTIFPYVRLGSLNRDVWAIHDPNWSTSELYEGGLDEMAGVYIDFIKNVGIRGSILLGGWSLGGYISLAIAKKLAGAVSPEFSIAGMLIIDSPLHIPMCKLRPAGPDPDFEHLPELTDFAMSPYYAGMAAIQALSKLS